MWASLPNQHILLRMGLHSGHLLADDHDVYGSGVNLAARLTMLAGPGESWYPPECAKLTPCSTPISRTWASAISSTCMSRCVPIASATRAAPGDRARQRGSCRSCGRRSPSSRLSTPRPGPSIDVLGEVLADEIIAALSRTPELNVISRLSTTAVPGPRYVVGRSQRASGGELRAVGRLPHVGVKLPHQWSSSRRPRPDASSGPTTMKGELAAIVSGKDGSSTTSSPTSAGDHAASWSARSRSRCRRWRATRC